MKQQTYTVVGFYEYTDQVFAYPVKASDPHEAMALACSGDYIDMSDSSDVCVVGAMDKRGMLHAPCDDSGTVAYACDLVPDAAEVKA